MTTNSTVMRIGQGRCRLPLPDMKHLLSHEGCSSHVIPGKDSLTGRVSVVLEKKLSS